MKEQDEFDLNIQNRILIKKFDALIERPRQYYTYEIKLKVGYLVNWRNSTAAFILEEIDKNEWVLGGCSY